MAHDPSDLEHLAKLLREGHITSEQYERMRPAVEQETTERTLEKELQAARDRQAMREGLPKGWYGSEDLPCDICANNIAVGKTHRHQHARGHSFFNLGEGPAPGAPEELPCDLCQNPQPSGEFFQHRNRTGHSPKNPGIEWTSRAREASGRARRIREEEMNRQLRAEARAEPLREKIGYPFLAVVLTVVLLAGFLFFVWMALEVIKSFGL